MKVDGNTAAIILDGDAVVSVNSHRNLVAVPLQSFVHAVVDQLINQVVQPPTPVLPMYMEGTFRTAFNPSRIFMFPAPYSFILDSYGHNDIFILFVSLAFKKHRSVSRRRLHYDILSIHMVCHVHEEPDIKFMVSLSPA